MAEQKTYEVLVIGGGVAGICQVKHLADRGVDLIALEAHGDLGGTWYRNRYPGCRFDSESYTYGYRFSREVLDEWHWKEHFSPQPENLKYLQFVADKFDLRRYFRFNARVASMQWDEADRVWTVKLESGETYRARFVVTCLGVLSIPVMPRIEGVEDFAGEAFHTFDWPDRPLDLKDRKVGIIGAGATGIQIIAEIADKVGELTVFQRRPNWSVPLNNAPISEEEMADIRARYDEIFEICNQSNGNFCHLPDRRGYAAATPEERRALWDELYDLRGFSLLLANFPETFLEEGANRDLSNYVAERIRQRVDDPLTAEKLIPKDHGFGMRRLPLETRYYEAYNRDNVHLVDLTQTPIERVTKTGIQTSQAHHDLDLIIYATGFDAVTGALDRIDIRGSGGRSLKEKWRDGPSTYLGVMTHGFPNLLMVAGPQSVSGSTNYPPAIEAGVAWVTGLLSRALDAGATRLEAGAEAEATWVEEVARMQDRMPFSKVKSWFTGYNPNAGEGASPFRYQAYWGGAPKYAKFLKEAVDNDYSQIAIG